MYRFTYLLPASYAPAIFLQVRDGQKVKALTFDGCTLTLVLLAKKKKIFISPSSRGDWTLVTGKLALPVRPSSWRKELASGVALRWSWVETDSESLNFSTTASLPVVISCILTCSLHICGIGVMVIIGLSNRRRGFLAGRKLKRRAAEVFSFERPNRPAGFRWNAQCVRGRGFSLRLQPLFLRGTIRRLIWLSWSLCDPLCWCYSSSEGAAGKLASIRTLRHFHVPIYRAELAEGPKGGIYRTASDLEIRLIIGTDSCVGVGTRSSSR